MAWRDFASWLRGGLIFLFITLILEILIVILGLSLGWQELSSEGAAMFLFPILILSLPGSLVSYIFFKSTVLGWIFTGIFSLVIYFIFGALIWKFFVKK